MSRDLRGTAAHDVKLPFVISADRDFSLLFLPDNRMKPRAYPFTMGPDAYTSKPRGLFPQSAANS